VDNRELADYYEAVVAACGDAKIAANWVQVELLGQLNKNELEIGASPVSAEALGGLIQRILDNSISGKIAKQVFEAMWQGEGGADEIIEARGLKQVSDSGELEAMVDEVIAGSAAQVEQYLAADDAKRKKLVGYFVGQVMKLSKGQANPQMWLGRGLLHAPQGLPEYARLGLRTVRSVLLWRKPQSQRYWQRRPYGFGDRLYSSAWC
jgi:aspartyl-tRNA(Asn)/glutamyl-tRNA(Gln) amidotransferase subunit B